VFINITGGISLEAPAIDLAVVAALLSSHNDLPIGHQICFAAEIGLSGEIRPVAKVEQRIQEAAKLGFEDIIVSKFSKFTTPPSSIRVHSFSKIESVIEFLFG